MFAEKITRTFNCKSWIVLKRLEPLIKKPVYSANRSITNNHQLTKNLLRSSNSTCTSSIRRHYAVANPTENSHAHQIMSNLSAYSKSISPKLSVAEDLKIDNIEDLLGQQWISMSSSEILENFKLLSYYAHQNYDTENFNNLKYKGIFDILAEKCSTFSNEELCDFLGFLQLWNNSDLHYNDLWKYLDNTCVDRLPILSVEQILLICDHFYKLNVAPFSNFIYHGMRKLSGKEMTPANLVQYAFLMKVKGPTSGVSIREFEFSVQKNIDKFNIEELSIICMSFFKYQTAIKSRKLFSKILQKLISDIDEVSDIALSSILKTLRYSADLNSVTQIDVLLRTLENQIEKRHIQTSTHAALAQAELLIYNENLLKKILEKFEKETENARLKDIERLTFVQYLFNCDPNTTSFYRLAEQELLNPKRGSEISKFIQPFVYTILYMLKVNYFPEELVKRIMTPNFINKFCHNNINTLDREYLDLTYCLQIDHPEYQGPQLRKDQIKYLIKKFGVLYKGQLYSVKFQKVDQAGKLMIDVSHQIKLTLGSESAIHVDYPLPYHNKQFIFMCYDAASKSFVPPAETLSQIPLGEIKYAPKDGKQWIAIVPASHNVLIRNTHQPTGMLAMQMRHLERLGYNVIIVTQSAWSQLTSVTRKMEFIRHILDDFQTERNK